MTPNILDNIRYTLDHEGYTNQSTIAGLLWHIDGLTLTRRHRWVLFTITQALWLIACLLFTYWGWQDGYTTGLNDMAEYVAGHLKELCTAGGKVI